MCESSRITLTNLTLRGPYSHGDTTPYYGGTSYAYGGTGITSCYDTCNWEAELYCDGGDGVGGSGTYYDGYDDPLYSSSAYDDDAIVTGRTRYGYNRSVAYPCLER